MVKNVLNWVEPLDKCKDYIFFATKFPDGFKVIRCNNCHHVKHVSKNITKKKEVTVIENIHLLKNKFILREMLVVENNKKGVLIDEGSRRNGKSTNDNTNLMRPSEISY